jgi:hypothetical protein
MINRDIDIEVFGYMGGGGVTVFSCLDVQETFKWTEEAVGLCMECRNRYRDGNLPPCCDCSGLNHSDDHNYFEEFDW